MHAQNDILNLVDLGGLDFWIEFFQLFLVLFLHVIGAAVELRQTMVTAENVVATAFESENANFLVA